MLFRNAPSPAAKLITSLISRAFPFGHAAGLALARFLRREQCGRFELMRLSRGEAI
jgi:hypothetical protein